MPIALLFGLVAGLIIGQQADAASRTAPEPVATWRPVTIPYEAPSAVAVSSPTRSGAQLQPRGVESAAGTPGGASLPPSPAAPSVEPTATVAASRPGTASPRRTARPTVSTHALTGTASWYCLPKQSACTVGYPASGAYAAAGPALRVGAWRGRWVTINGWLRLRLIDWCLCSGGKVIDVYASQFAKLAPLSRGVIQVVVKW